jgi:hypothetical protein
MGALTDDERTVLGVTAAGGATAGAARVPTQALRKPPMDAAEARVNLAVIAARDAAAAAGVQRMPEGVAASSVGGKSQKSRLSLMSAAAVGSHDPFAIPVPAPPPPSAVLSLHVSARVLTHAEFDRDHGREQRAAFAFPLPAARVFDDPARTALPPADGAEPADDPHSTALDTLRAPPPRGSAPDVLESLLQSIVADVVADVDVARAVLRAAPDQQPFTFRELHRAAPHSEPQEPLHAVDPRAWVLRGADLHEWVPKLVESTLLNIVREAVNSDSAH